MAKGISSLLIFILLSSCGWLDQDRNNSNQRVFEDHKTAEKSFNHSRVICERGECPEYVGGLLALSSDRLEIKACSFTLVSKNTVLTNAHCVPEDLLKDGAFCVGRINVLFPKTDGKPMERRDCSYIKKVSDQSFSSQVAYPDWALIRLSHSVDRALPQSSIEGVNAGTLINLFKVDFDLDAESSSLGRIIKTQCQANTNFFLSQHNLGPRSPLVDLSHCDQKLISGNSGSGYFNQEGKLIGIHSWGVSVETSNESWAQFFREKYPDITQNFGGGVHLSCIPLKGDFKQPSHCEFKERSYPRLSELFAKTNQQRLWQESFENVNREVLAFNTDTSVRWTKTMQTKKSVLFFEKKESVSFLWRRVFNSLLVNQFPSLPYCATASQDSFDINLSYRRRKDSTPFTDPLTLERLLPSEEARESLEAFWQENEQAYLVELTELIEKEDLLAFGDGLSEGLYLRLPPCE